ncbi:MAG: protein kinase domain-containing protein [Planctomycetaceae bacterium]
MSSIGSDDLIPRLPLPLAQLYRRARNAKTPQDRHHHAFYLAEATLKLAACLRIGAVLSQGLDPHDPLARALEQLCLPSIGQWVGFLRETTLSLQRHPELCPALRESNEELLRPEAFVAVRRFAQAASAGDSAPLSTEQVRDATRRGVLGFFDLIAAYRNQVFGHGAARLPAYYEAIGPLLFEALCEVLQQRCLFGDLTLAVARLSDMEAGQLLKLDWQRLHGTASQMLSGDAVSPQPDDDETQIREAAGRVFFIASGVRIPLHPLVVYFEDREERERFGFLNRTVTKRRSLSDSESAEEVRRCEYLDYSTGEQLREVDARRELTELLSRLRGELASASDVDRLMALAETEPDEATHWLGTGDVIGDFELAGELGRGAMGIVYRARQMSLNRWVALKVLPPALGADPVSLGRFRREIAALSRCEHPNLVKIFSSGNDGDRHFYAMELIDGANLADVAAALSASPAANKSIQTGILNASSKRPLSADQPANSGQVHDETALSGQQEFHQSLAKLFKDAADALNHLHARGILHRDLKPANLMLTADGQRVVIMDLGLAHLRDRSQSLTGTDARWVGTLRYCSPEQVQSNLRDVDERADVYGLGATFYELATLTPLFDGDTVERLLTQVLHVEPTDPCRRDPTVPKDLAAILVNCLEKERSRRYANARDLGDDLGRFLLGQPVRVRPLTSVQRLWKWGRRNPRVAMLSTALAASLIVLATGSTLQAIRINAALLDAQRLRVEAEQQADKLKTANATAEEQRERAVRGEAAAIQQEKQVELERDRALTEKENAQRYFNSAKEAVDYLYKRVSEEKLLATTGLEPLRKELLDTTRRFYEEFAENLEHDDPDGADLERAELLIRLALITAEISSDPQPKRRAIESFEKAEKILERKLRENEDDPEIRSLLEALYVGLSGAYQSVGQSEQAQRTIAKQRKLTGDNAALLPKDLGTQLSDAASRYNEGVVLQRAGRLDEARKLIAESHAIRVKIAEAHPDEPIVQLSLGLSFNGLASLDIADKPVRARKLIRQALDCMARALKLDASLAENSEFQNHRATFFGNLGHAEVLAGNPEAAVTALQTSIDIFERLAAQQPKVMSHLVGLVRARRTLTVTLITDNETEAAKEVADSALAILNRLTPEQQQEQWEILVEVGQTCFNMGLLLTEDATWLEAEEYLGHAVKSLESALRQFPNQPNAKGLLRSSLSARARVFNRLARHREALADCDRLSEFGERDPSLTRLTALAGVGKYEQATDAAAKSNSDGDDARYELATLYAVAAAAANRDQDITGDARAEATAEYTGRALNLLFALNSNGYFHNSKRRVRDLRANRCFEVLQKQTGFRNLLRQLGASE